MILVRLPEHLSQFARITRNVQLDQLGCKTQNDLIDALESKYPVLKGAIRDISTGNRRAFIRFFANGEDLSLDGLDSVLPENVLAGEEILQIVGAIAGG